MAQAGGHVLQRHIDEIMEKHGVPGKLYPCRWEGTFDYSVDQTILDSGGLQHAEAHLAFHLSEDQSGLRGTLDGDLSQNLQLPTCPSTTQTPAHVKVEIGGSRRRPTKDHRVPSLQLSVLSEQRGRPRPINDTWIAACCLVADLPLATLNVKDFKDFAEHDGLQIIGLEEF